MSGRNPDLPILDELGEEFAALVGAAGGESPGARRRLGAVPSRARRERRSQAHRIGRRTAIVLALVCLVGGVAFAALRGGGSRDRANTSPTSIGRARDGAWTFSVHRDAGRLCGVFVPRRGEPVGRCGIAPGRGRATAQSAFIGGDRYVFGLAGTGVATVAMSPHGPGSGGAGEPSRSGRVRSPIDQAAARDAGLPSGDRWFVVNLGPVAGPGEGRTPVVVTPLDRRGRRAGAPYVDCSLGIASGACKRRIEAAAARG